MPPPQPRARPSSLPHELIEEVLLRVPPDDPASLVRAALACKRWCRLVADPAFRRRRLDLHRAATLAPRLPASAGAASSPIRPSAAGASTSTVQPRAPRANHPGLGSFDARHCRVLLHDPGYSDFIVWDPITDQLVELPSPPSLGNGPMKATVLCAATANGACDHLDCHRGPFIVVLVGTYDDIIGLNVDDLQDVGDDDCVSDGVGRWFWSVPFRMFSCIYSSESGAWS